MIAEKLGDITGPKGGLNQMSARPYSDGRQRRCPMANAAVDNRTCNGTVNAPVELVDNPVPENSPAALNHSPTEGVEARTFEHDDTFAPRPESGCPWHTCIAGTRCHIAAAHPTRKPDRHWLPLTFRQEARWLRRWQHRSRHFRTPRQGRRPTLRRWPCLQRRP